MGLTIMQTQERYLAYCIPQLYLLTNLQGGVLNSPAMTSISKHGPFTLQWREDTGPRITGLYVQGIEGNLLVETPNIVQETPHGKFYLRGGHRLWEAPELTGITGLPDTELDIETKPNGVRMSARPNAIGLAKTIEFEVVANQIKLMHTISNHGQQTFRLAPWAITQLRPGGKVLVPGAEPGTSETKMPNRNLVFWPYSDSQQNSVIWADGLHFDPALVKTPFKFGTFAAAGRVEVRYPQYTFAKIFAAELGAPYPDFNSNLEFFVADAYLEVETLAPLADLRPGQAAHHEEIWEITLK